MELTLEKLERRIAELAPYRYRGMKPTGPFQAVWDADGSLGGRPPQVGPDVHETLGVGDRWSGRDRYVWLVRDIAIPEPPPGEVVVGKFDFGVTGSGNNAGFEGLVFLDGEPYQGIDSNHQELFFPQNRWGQTVRLALWLWTGLEGGGPPKDQEHVVRESRVGWLDSTADDLYYSARAVLESAKVLSVGNPWHHQLLASCDGALSHLDWSEPGSPEFYQSVSRASEELSKRLQALRGAPSPVTIHAVGHTHIDVAWLWRLRHTRAKAARSFSTVLRLMERYPDYQFIQSQPQLYAYLKDDYPELYAQIVQRVAEGRWEPEGAMWLEADCNLPSGESLVRQILVGTEFFSEEFGRRSEILWLPDAFGFSGALPQILAKSGIKAFMTTKLSWNQTNRMPHDTFRWRGIDGSEVMAHFVTTPSRPLDVRSTYNGDITAASVTGIWDAYQDKDLNQDLLLSFGHGDGGGGPTRDMLEMRRRLEDMPGMPRVKSGIATQYFRDLAQRLETAERATAVWDDELYLEYHRGTFTSQGAIKRLNRKLELALRRAEWMAVQEAMAHHSWAHYPGDALKSIWQVLLRNQFHDILPGSSIAEVYEDARAELGDALERAEALGQQSASRLASASHDGLTVYNAANWARVGPVRLPVLAPGEAYAADDGRRLPAQSTAQGVLVEVEVPAFGSTRIRRVPDDSRTTEPCPFDAGERRLTTPFYEVEWNAYGQMTRLYDREAQREIIAAGECANVLQVFEDKPLRFDAWDIDPFYQDKRTDVTALKAWTVVEAGPLRAVYRATWQFGKSTIDQDIVFFAHHRRIEFHTHVDWHQRQQLLKVAFPVSIRAREATYDIQFGNIKRPTHANTSWDAARFESVAHQWVDLSEHDYGVSLLNDSKYGHDVKDHVMRLSLLKSALYPDPDADQGAHQFVYALFPHPGDWQQSGTVQAAWDVNDPLIIVEGDQASMPPNFVFTGHPVMVDAVKRSEDGHKMVIRCHEYQGGRGRVELAVSQTGTMWQECDLLERPSGSVHSGPISFDIRPYEIRTFLIEAF
ncbi:alpha-mannosidase [Sulfobacillus harzensis]|uniref:Alpha-mannosidase n=1 Tax=Sulfobacillus harzensis TaxID=2729629 RepID=A0A7Y0L468_9FIRM|nr:alpha-mannosidase [Sulfobacillus harzensis]NMP22753.1 alpha-mannosidase [Sulfobacillus harzensis]